MQLTSFSDYSLRTLFYLGTHREGLISIGQVARAYRISINHMVKVAHLLVKLGLVEAVRGRGGGLRLALPPEHINVGLLIRQTEPNMELAECFNDRTNTCVISSACRFKDALYDARKAFIGVLDQLTLADLLRDGQQNLMPLWLKAEAEAPPPSKSSAKKTAIPGGTRPPRRRPVRVR